MKTMNTMKMWAALLVAGLALCACSSDDNELIPQTEEPQAPQAQTFTMTVSASKGGDAATTRGTLTDNGTTVTPEWEVNDEVSVYNASDVLLGTIKAQTAGATTTLIGELTTAPAVSDVLTLKYKSANYATQDGTLAGIAANCDYATATVTVSAVDDKKITTSDASFASQQAIVKFTLKNSDGSATLDASQLVVVTNGTTYTVTPASEASTLYVALPAITNKFITLVATVGGAPYDFVKGGVTFANSNFYRIGVKMTECRTTTATIPADLGRVIGADGHAYVSPTAATAAGTTVSGIIAYVGSAGSVDESSTTYKGLAIALTDANNGNKCAWYTESSGTCVSQTDNPSTALGYKNGIACTETLVNSDGTGVTTNCSGHIHAAAITANSYPTARPSGVSAWFLPSMGQWQLIVQGLATKHYGHTYNTALTTSSNASYKAAGLNNVITSVGGTGFQSYYYWASTGYQSGKAYNMGFEFGSLGALRMTEDAYVRAVFAF